MTIVFALLAAVFLGLLVASTLRGKRLEKLVADRDAEIAGTKQESERIRQHYESEAVRIDREAQAALGNAQELVNQQLAALGQESERVRQHYEAEARRIQSEADAALSKVLKELEPLRRFEGLRDAEAETQRVLTDAMNEATALRKEAQTLLEQSRIAAVDERSQAFQKAKALREQADALLNQATRDAGRILAEAEKRAEQIGGDAYRALREKEQLEQAAEAMRNVVEGYGDRYLVPTHSLLDDLAAEFGYAAAGESLKSARDLSRRMVEQGQAATCEYVEAARRTTAIQFVIHAFNGRVDATLSRVKHDNYGTLEQEIRDAFSLVNKDGKAFRDARILPAYLDARLAELKWGVVVQELARQRQEEQRAIREEIRDRELAKQEQAEKLREAEKLEELKKLAAEENERELAEAKKKLAEAAAEDKVKWEQTISELEQQNQGLRQDLAAATEQKLQISQQTKVGHVYVLSNIGSFGDGVYKIGETQREAEVRVKELGGASVPFEFDIHAVIETENSRVLEKKLHKRFMSKRVNRQNSRKEFFRVSLTEIRQEVEKLKEGKDFTGRVNWTEEARATQWKETRDIESSPEKLEKWLRSEQAKDRRSPEFDAGSSFEEF